MIYGIGTDIVQVSRFQKWVENPNLAQRFFSAQEISAGSNLNNQQKCEYYASRFSVKEAFVKALGTGFSDFKISEIMVLKDEKGKPIVKLEGKAISFTEELCGKNYKIHVSLSHEKEYAVSYVIIEKEI